jgi:type II secretory pathway component GspD/PulD (secretin)
MTGEEMERAIDFLLKSQANLEARIEQVNANLGMRIDETNRQLGETNRQLGETNRQLGETNRQLGDYANTQTTLIQVITRTFEAQAAINKRTDERLNALIVTVEKLINERGSKP